MNRIAIKRRYQEVQDIGAKKSIFVKRSKDKKIEIKQVIIKNLSLPLKDRIQKIPSQVNRFV